MRLWFWNFNLHNVAPKFEKVSSSVLVKVLLAEALISPQPKATLILTQNFLLWKKMGGVGGELIAVL